MEVTVLCVSMETERWKGEGKEDEEGEERKGGGEEERERQKKKSGEWNGLRGGSLCWNECNVNVVWCDVCEWCGMISRSNVWCGVV